MRVCGGLAVLTTLLPFAAFAQTPIPPVQNEATGPLSGLASDVLANGLDTTVPGTFATYFGLTAKNQIFPMKEKAYGVSDTDYVTDTYYKIFEVSRAHGRVDIVIVRRTANEAALYLTSVQGNLENAFHVNKDESIQAIPLAEAEGDFEKEKAFWLAQPLPLR